MDSRVPTTLVGDGPWIERIQTRHARFVASRDRPIELVVLQGEHPELGRRCRAVGQESTSHCIGVRYTLEQFVTSNAGAAIVDLEIR